MSSGGPTSPVVNPRIEDLLKHGVGKVLMIGGYVGPAADGQVRLYEDLSLRTQIEIAKSAASRGGPSGDRDSKARARTDPC